MLQPGMPQTSSRTYCLPWDVFQQWRDMFQLKKTHAYTFTAGGINFSDMQRKEGDAPAEEDARLHLHSRGDQLLGHAEQTGGSTSRTNRGRREMRQLKKRHAYTFTAGGIKFSDMQGKGGDALSRVAAMFATTAAHSCIVINSSPSQEYQSRPSVVNVYIIYLL